MAVGDDLAHRHLQLLWIFRISEDIASRPDLGPYEVGLMDELLQAADELTGERERRERQAFTRRFGMGRGRAVDVPPSVDVFEEIQRRWGVPASGVSGERSFQRSLDEDPHVHWAYDLPDGDLGLTAEQWARLQQMGGA